MDIVYDMLMESALRGYASHVSYLQCQRFLKAWVRPPAAEFTDFWMRLWAAP